MLWIGLGIGLAVGASFGVIMMGIVCSSAHSDRSDEVKR
jgi:hypothetical protein